ncbi:hypothetical protein RRG08_065211 [Elysia crispata]|uniref:Uncharacterized protein n=1 Tax=Elysia crispata TaxID=231223 RepID=A0AAE0YHH1_9GAST|nr:hypothetical protein RRG08_065211 [Elysia crispata]
MGVDSPSEATTSQSGARPHPASEAAAAAKADYEAHEDEKTALIGPADAQKFALGHWGDAGPFCHSEDISRGLNSGLDLYNGLPKIFKRACFYGRGRLAHLLVGFVEVRNILGR